MITTERYMLGPVDAIPPGEGRNFRLVDGREIAVFRTRTGELYATQSRCPHRGAPLADGLIGGGRVVCPFHGFAFELATGEPLMSSCAALDVYPIELGADGMLYSTLEPVEGQGQPCVGR